MRCNRLDPLETYEQCGTAVGAFRFTDQNHVDEAAPFAEKTDEWPRVLTDFDDAADTMGLHTSWTKTKLQNIGSGPQPSTVVIQLRPLTASLTWAVI